MTCIRFVPLALGVALLSAGTAAAATFEYPPRPVASYDLTPQKYYTCRIDSSDFDGQRIASASLFFDNIRNGTREANDLDVHLLPGASVGLAVGTDSQGGGDNFAGQGSLLVHYVNLPSGAQDLTYAFTGAELTALGAWSADGNFGLGLPRTVTTATTG